MSLALRHWCSSQLVASQASPMDTYQVRARKPADPLSATAPRAGLGSAGTTARPRHRRPGREETERRWLPEDEPSLGLSIPWIAARRVMGTRRALLDSTGRWRGEPTIRRSGQRRSPLST